jgi:phage baseplate assembly protein W
MALYVGYSTIDQNKSVTLTDADLIKRDLINHFYIRRGEKLMNPNFGTIIWDSIFEPFTEQLKVAIVDDVTRIARYDPRLRVDQILVDQFEHGLLIELRLEYVGTNELETLKLIFDRRVVERY